MHTNQTQNQLVIENPEQLNWPEEIKSHLSSIQWDEVFWTAFGLPSFFSSFCVTGNQLYFESDAENQMSLKKEEFTGQVIASTTLVPDKHDKVFIVVFELTFCKGILCESRVDQFQANPRENYEKGFAEFKAQQEKWAKTLSSWWFKWLYLPYYTVVKGLGWGVIFVGEFILHCFAWLVNLLLPIKLG